MPVLGRITKKTSIMKSRIEKPRFENLKSAVKKLKICIAGLAVVSVTFFACNNDDDNANGDSFDDSELLKTSAVIDRINEEDFQIAMETANDHSTLESRPAAADETSLTSCATVTQTSTGIDFPLTFNLDFGAGCTQNGVTRSGSLTITYTGFLLTAGSQMIIERNNYTVNGYEITGTVTYENMTTDLATPQWSRTVVNGQITTPDGDVYTHSGSRIVRQTEGVGTPIIVSDNVFEISSGSATVTRQGGSTLNATIVSPLVKSASCSYISQGVLHLEGGLLDGDLDYGNGDCNDTAVYTHSDGQEYTVILN